jgi:malate permease and related proteins
VLSPVTVIASVLPVYLLILAGALLRKAGIIRKEHDEGMMRVVYAVMLPCFILDKILGSAGLRNGGVVFWAVGIGFGLIMLGILVGLIVGRLVGLEKGNGMRTFALTAGCQNFGFMALPVSQILWGSGIAGLLLVHNIGVELAVWSVGVMMISGGRGILWRRLVNGPIVAVVIGLTLMAFKLDGAVTGPVRQTISMLGIGAFPLAIFITGCAMADLIGEEKLNWKVISSSAVARLILTPIGILCVAKFSPIPTELRQILVVQAAMPAGMSAIMIARLYGGRPAVAVQIVIATTILSFLTLPWMIIWGSQWIGLKPLLH